MFDLTRNPGAWLAQGAGIARVRARRAWHPSRTMEPFGCRLRTDLGRDHDGKGLRATHAGSIVLEDRTLRLLGSDGRELA